MNQSARFQTKQQRLDWYKAAKFGLFLHWGPYSLAGVEASWPIMAPELAAVAFGEQPAISEADYVSLAQRLNPTDFDPRAWVRSAQGAGMRYGPLQDIPFATTTTKRGAIYLHVLAWPASGQIVLERLDEVSSISLLATGKQLTFSQSGGNLVIEMPRQAPDPVLSVLAIYTT